MPSQATLVQRLGHTSSPGHVKSFTYVKENLYCVFTVYSAVHYKITVSARLFNLRKWSLAFWLPLGCVDAAFINIILLHKPRLIQSNA